MDGYRCAKTCVSDVEGHEKAQKSKFLQINMKTVKELLIILQANPWNKYSLFQAKSDTFEAT